MKALTAILSCLLTTGAAAAAGLRIDTPRIWSDEGNVTMTPVGVAADINGDLIVAESIDNVISRVRPDGKVERIAGIRGPGGFANGRADESMFRSPQAVVIASDGTIFVADAGNHVIRRIERGHVSTWAGKAGQPGTADGAAEARFVSPTGLALGPDGTLWVSDGPSHTIRMITPDGRVRTVAGHPGLPGATDGSGGTARFDHPRGLALGIDGTIWIADSGNHLIRRLDRDGVVTTWRGAATPGRTVDGNGSACSFDEPFGIAELNDGSLLVTELRGHTVRRVDRTGDCSTVAGAARQTGNRDGYRETVRFTGPAGIAVLPDGRVAIADLVNRSVRWGRVEENERRRAVSR